MKRMLKTELARAAGVSDRTFSRWFQKMIPQIERDLHISINSRDRLVSPSVAKWVQEKYDIELD